jgi:plastocyanin
MKMHRSQVAAGFLAVGVLTACGSDGAPAPTAERPTPTSEASVYEVPEPDTVPLSKARKGDLIALPAYPQAAVYGGTADVRGMESFQMKIPLVDNLHAFGPSVLIGSPGQQITLTGFTDKAASPIEPHDFRISDGPEASDDIPGEQWEAGKGTEFTITFPEAGKLAFYCSYHVRTKMAGILIVRD